MTQKTGATGQGAIRSCEITIGIGRDELQNFCMKGSLRGVETTGYPALPLRNVRYALTR